MTKPTTLLLTGLIRIPERFLRTVALAHRLMAEGVLAKTVLATWCGEVDKYDGLRQVLQEAGIQIVEIPEPDKSTVGNIWQQMVAYAAGLVQITTPYVLKSRPDVFIAERVIRRLVSDIPRKPDRGLLPTPFLERVWAPWMVISRPFYLADECFFATLQDAWLLHNIDLNYDNWGVDSGLTHIRRFINPFRYYEEARLLLSRYPNAEYGTMAHYHRLQIWLKNPEHVRILCCYYAIIRRCFDIYTESGDIEFRPWSIPVVRPGPEVMPLAAHFTERLDHHCHDDSFIDAIADGLYDHEPLGQMLSAGIRDYENAPLQYAHEQNR